MYPDHIFNRFYTYQRPFVHCNNATNILCKISKVPINNVWIIFAPLYFGLQFFTSANIFYTLYILYHFYDSDNSLNLLSCQMIIITGQFQIQLIVLNHLKYDLLYQSNVWEVGYYQNRINSRFKLHLSVYLFKFPQYQVGLQA